MTRSSFPGRIEDLDLGFRGWMAGYRGYYVPESVAYHQGFGTFEPQLGKGRCDAAGQPQHADLHVEKHRRSPAVDPLSLAADPARVCTSARTIQLCHRALGGPEPCDVACWRARRALAVGQGGWVERQEAFFRRFQW